MWQSGHHLLTNLSTYDNVADMSPEIRMKAKDSDPTWWKRKVIRGGSWKDVVTALTSKFNRDYEFADTAKAFIGFRNIVQYISPALTNKNQENKTKRQLHSLNKQ
jgi:sulfatase modifying factor 1